MLSHREGQAISRDIYEVRIALGLASSRGR